jgi:hypothetical protein
VGLALSLTVSLEVAEGALREKDEAELGTDQIRTVRERHPAA